MTRIYRSFLALAAVVVLGAFAGPPWLSIEFPANPHDATTRAAFLVVNTYHHETPTAMALAGTAEGIVRGERRTIPLRFTSTSRTGSYAVARQWPTEGKWVLSIALRNGDRTDASALVVLGADGTPSRVSVPTRSEGQWRIPRALSASELTAALAAAGEQGTR